jgi:hypothetical protein
MSLPSIKMIVGLRTALDAKIETFAKAGAVGSLSVYKGKTGQTGSLYGLRATRGVLELAVANDEIAFGVDFGSTVNADVEGTYHAAAVTGGALVALSGENLTGLSASNVTTGTLSSSLIGLAEDKLLLGDNTGKASQVSQTALSISGFGAANADIDLGAFKISTSATNFADDELVTMGVIKGLFQGLDQKDSVRLKTTGNFPLTGYAIDGNGFLTSGGDVVVVDGKQVKGGERMLLASQTDATQNGIYIAGTTLTRSLDMDTFPETPAAYVFVEDGTAYAATGWISTTVQGGTLGTDPINFQQFSGGGSYTGQHGIVFDGNVINVQTDDVTVGIVSGNVSVVSSSTSGQILRSTGSGAAEWGALNLASSAAVTGTLAVTNGGTGLSTIAANTVLIANSSDTISALAMGTNTLLGRKSGGVVALAAADIRELAGSRPGGDVGTATSGSMDLLTLTQTPTSGTLQVFYRGIKLLAENFTLVSNVVTATIALNESYGGTGSDGLGFDSQDSVEAIYTY